MVRRRAPGYGAEPAPGLPVLEESEEKRPRNPFTRMTHKLPRPWRIALDWVLTIAGRRPDRPRDQGLGGQSVPHPVVVHGADAALRALGGPASGCEAHFSDRVLANRFIYHLRDPNRGEIVVFNTPPKAQLECGAGGTFVKRLIGLPGEQDPREDRLVLHQRKAARTTPATSSPAAATTASGSGSSRRTPTSSSATTGRNRATRAAGGRCRAGT